MASTTSSALLHLHPSYPVTSLPAHPHIPSGSPTQTAQDLALRLLTEAHTFAKNTLPTLTKKSPSKSSSGSLAPVLLRHGTVANDYWVSRTSRHAGKAVAGDATWDEFDRYERLGHSKHEAEYTPTVSDYVEVAVWDVGSDDSTKGWTQVSLGVYEMRHEMPFPLKARAFTVLLASGIPPPPESILLASSIPPPSTTSIPSPGREFILATVPLEPLPKGTQGSKFGVGVTGVVHGAYVAIERVFEEGGEIVWDMATASDAKGSLPLGMQKLGVAGAVTKDVGLFMRWVGEKREG